MAYTVGFNYGSNNLPITIVETREPVTGKLVQQGPVHNNVTTYQGTFASIEEAAGAVARYFEVRSIWLVSNCVDESLNGEFLIGRPDMRAIRRNPALVAERVSIR
jgi:hypothetical protein